MIGHKNPFFLIKILKKRHSDHYALISIFYSYNFVTIKKFFIFFISFLADSKMDMSKLDFPGGLWNFVF